MQSLNGCVSFCPPVSPYCTHSNGKLHEQIVGSCHWEPTFFFKISPLIFQLSFKITNCHHETGFSCCLRLSAGFDQFRPHFALGMGLEIFFLLLLLLLENSSFEVMPRAESDGRNLSCALPICLHRHTIGDGNAALHSSLGLCLALVHLEGRIILCLSYSTF